MKRRYKYKCCNVIRSVPAPERITKWNLNVSRLWRWTSRPIQDWTLTASAKIIIRTSIPATNEMIQLDNEAVTVTECRIVRPCRLKPQQIQFLIARLQFGHSVTSLRRRYKPSKDSNSGTKATSLPGIKQQRRRYQRWLSLNHKGLDI